MRVLWGAQGSETWCEALTELPVWDVLRDLHRRLCELEGQLRWQRPAECLRNLYGRVHAAGMLGLELERPEWAA